jgi:hypothetical protein
MTKLKYYEIEEFRRAQNSKMWWVIVAMGSMTTVSLLTAMLVMLRPVPVIAFDADGRAMVFKDTVTPGSSVNPARVRSFSKHFLDHYVGIDSTRLTEDLKKALALMTPLTQELVVRTGTQVKRRAAYDGKDVRSQFLGLQMEVEEFDSSERSPIHLFAWGAQRFSPIFGRGKSLDQYIFVKLILERTTVTEKNPWGLLVKYVEFNSYDDPEKIELERLKLIRE